MQSTLQESNKKKFSDFEFIKSFSNVGSFFYLDEVGRGPLAGPVVSACVSLDPNCFDHCFKVLDEVGVIDSKKLSRKRRLKILESLGINISEVSENIVYRFKNLEGLSFAISSCNHQEIDEINILQSSLLSMKRALQVIKRSDSIQSGVALIDGNKAIEVEGVKPCTLIKGDLKSKFIAIASIIAKEYRDSLMEHFAQKYPEYGFEKHSGYPTKFHKEQLIIHGACPIHRLSFNGVSLS